MASVLDNLSSMGGAGMQAMGDAAQRGMDTMQNFGNTDFSKLLPLLMDLIKQSMSQPGLGGPNSMPMSPNPMSGVQSGAPSSLKKKITTREEY